MPQMLVALDFSLTKPRQIIIAGNPTRRIPANCLRKRADIILPNTIVLLADGGEGQKFLAAKLEEMKEMRPIDGKAAAYVCENFTCKAPVTSTEELRKLLTR